MLDIHTNDFNYVEISPPLIVNEDVMFGTGQLPKFEEDQFEIKFENSDQRKFLIPTAEVVLTNLVRKSLINKEYNLDGNFKELVRYSDLGHLIYENNKIDYDNNIFFYMFEKK